MSTSFLRRPSNMAGGVAVGGADTGFDIQPQEHFWTVTLTDEVTSKEVVVPAGAIITGSFIAPHEEAIPTAGTGKIERITGGAGGTVAATVLAATAATGATITAITAAQVTVDTRYRFTAASLSTSSAVRLGLRIIMPRIRP